jgi:hypothetical protein
VTFLESQTYLIENKLNGKYSDLLAGANALFSLSEVKTAIDLAAKRAWNYKPWPFTRDALKLTYTPPVSGEFYMDCPNTFEDDSIYLLTVNDAEWSKRNFADYKKWFSDYPNATEKLWASFKRFFFANKNALTSGDEIALYGKLRVSALVNDGDLLPFSPDSDNNEDSGNQAIVRLAFSDLLGSEKKKEYAQAAAEEKGAYAILNALWAPMASRESREQNQNRGFFEVVPDYFANPSSGRSKSNGTFN